MFNPIVTLTSIFYDIKTMKRILLVLTKHIVDNIHVFCTLYTLIFLSDVGLRLELANCKLLIKLEDECEVTELI